METQRWEWKKKWKEKKEKKNIGKGCVCVYLCGWTDDRTREENNFIVPDTPDTTTLLLLLNFLLLVWPPPCTLEDKKKIAKRRIISAPLPKAFLIANTTTIGLWKRKAVHSFVGSGKGRREGAREGGRTVGLSGLSCYPLKTQKPTNKVSEKTEKNWQFFFYGSLFRVHPCT